MLKIYKSKSNRINIIFDHTTIEYRFVILQFSLKITVRSANECWERRKKLIDWNNLFVMMYTEDRNLANEFVKLPYKKMCYLVQMKSC
ncbi:DUF1919 domain-containing protein [Clostridium butyricum]|uniref:DUF1919 domain-containing protein n=1 Tax=Clostridium butyricum TaxID=1492 RepID=UPI003D333058